ncbi:MAG: hypothetical protein JWQ64_1038 [Subtercola sp.]|jgi:hypothetical protein|nr:hypothetical protein [Subtercola sp.]
MKLPNYSELSLATHGGRSAWGVFGEDDSLGLMNLITPEITLAAAQLVRSGEVVPLNAPLDLFDPPMFSRSPLTHTVIQLRGGKGLDDLYDGLNPQASSQWDSLGHVAYRDDAFYNGATLDDVLTGKRNTIDYWARRGIATRGVLLDLQASAETPYDPGSPHVFTIDDLERARLAAGVEYEVGDIIVLHTGFLDWYRSLSPSGREEVSTREGLHACGIAHTEQVAEYLWNAHAVAVVSDNPSLEVWPMDLSEPSYPFGMLHQILIAQFGMGIGELWELGGLARACARAERWEFFLTSAPLNASKGIASPANALAIL